MARYLIYDVLEIGARNGGLSLFYALNNANVVCSDLQAPSLLARKLHEKYNVKNIEYKMIDATEISDEYNGKFDIITFKSVLGIGTLGYGKQKQMVESVKRCLKSGGVVIFAENMQASGLHHFLEYILENMNGIMNVSKK